jgi:hypothetical protein
MTAALSFEIRPTLKGNERIAHRVDARRKKKGTSSARPGVVHALDARHLSERIFMHATRMLGSCLGPHRLINGSFPSSRQIMRDVASELRRTPRARTRVNKTTRSTIAVAIGEVF